MTSNTLFSFCGIALIALLFVNESLGHSYLTSPISRSDQTQSNSGCRGPACLGPCDLPLASATRAPIVIQRGALINPQWPRNNHAGGFIRFSWAQTADSDSAAAFDSGVSTIHCHEIGGCQPDDPTDPNGGDSGPADGSSQPCQVNITVPTSLTNGLWTLQWAWFGGAFSLGDYYSCVDYQISGGPSGSPATPLYYGGDYSNPGQNVCKFFNTDRLHQCVDEPCNNPIYPLSQQETGPAFGIAVAGSPTPSPAPTPSPPASVTTQAMTTAAPVPSTTQAHTTAAAPTPSPTPSPTPAHTTGAAPTPSPTHAHTTGMVSTPTPTPSSNCAGASVLSQSQATIMSVDTWTTSFRMVVNIDVQEASLPHWYLEVIWPSSATATSVSATYNAGMLQCQSTTPNLHAVFKPVASWAMNVPSGTVLTVEILASNTNNMSPDYLMANTQVKVFSQ